MGDRQYIGRTFTAAAAASEAAPDDKTDGVLRRRGLGLRYRGNRPIGRRRKWPPVLKVGRECRTC